MHKLQSFILVSILFNPIIINAQNFHYSNPEKKGLISSFNIIGRVKDKILVWQTDKDHPENSGILIYDNDMKIVKRVNTNLIQNGDLFAVNFVAKTDSFQVIYQYLKNNKLMCELATYNSEGLNTGNQQIDSLPLDKPDEFNEKAFVILKPDHGQSFALVRAEIVSDKTVKVLYHYSSEKAMYSGETLLPFYPNKSILENLILDDKANILVALSSKCDSGSDLTIYKINAVNNVVTNTLRKLPAGNVMYASLNMVEKDGNYLICSGWQQDSLKGIFLWQLNYELDDVKPDAIVTDNILNDSLFTKLNKFRLTVFQMNGYFNIFLGSEDRFQLVTNPATIWSNQPTYIYKPTDSENMIALQRAADITNSFNYETQQNIGGEVNKVKEAPEKYILASLSFDVKNNYWAIKSFNGGLEPHVLSFINNATIIKNNSSYNILFEQMLSNKKNGVGMITLKPDNNYTYNNLVLTHLKYHLQLNNIVQISPNEIIAPLSYRNEMVFVRIVFN